MEGLPKKGVNPICTYCGERECDLEHLMWECAEVTNNDHDEITTTTAQVLLADRERT